MDRLYEILASQHLSRYQQMLFLMGPRQVGKTTLSKHLLEQRKGTYLNWDIAEDRATLLGPVAGIKQLLGSRVLGREKPLLIIDEIHKFKDWKNHLKGIFDALKEECAILVTGSARMDVFQKGGDSLMGRYIPFTVHPLTVRELAKPALPTGLIQEPIELEPAAYTALFTFGGFPDPYIQKSPTFWAQWQRTRSQQLFREDIRDLSIVQDIAQLELLAHFIQEQSGQLVNYTKLGNKIRMTDQTVRRWMALLEAQYYCFTISPWSTNISRSLLKEPKVYLWDWSIVKSEGSRFENMVACHLAKAISYWEEAGLGMFSLHFLRDKDGHEVDFLVSRDQKPWFIVECKFSEDRHVSGALKYYQDMSGAQHAFEVVHNMAYTGISCFSEKKPIMVPAQTFLSQLL